jgi:hypothetical protein
LLQILTKLQDCKPEDQICSDLQDLFGMMNTKVNFGLKELHTNFADMYASRRFDIAEVVWAPRIWCFFVMLRLRHDEDFSRALWDKGFRFVGCDLDPTSVAPDKEAWTQQVLSAGVLPDGAGGVGGGGGGGGVAGVAANPFAEDPNSPEMLVARLLKAEGREVDDEAREADGELLPARPPLSARVSKTRQRMRLVYQGLALIARPLQEVASLLRKLSVCRQSEREAKELIDKETYDFIFKAPAAAAAAAKGVGGGTRSAASSVSTRGTRGAGGSRGGEREETTHLQRQKRPTIF